MTDVLLPSAPSVTVDRSSRPNLDTFAFLPRGLVKLYCCACEIANTRTNTVILSYLMQLDASPDLCPSELDFSQNYLGNPGAIALIETVKGMRWVRSLNLQNTGLGEAAIIVLCDVAKSHSHLEHINIRGNEVFASSGRRLTELLHRQPRIVSLHVEFDGMPPRIAHGLRVALGRNIAKTFSFDQLTRVTCNQIIAARKEEEDAIHRSPLPQDDNNNSAAAEERGAPNSVGMKRRLDIAADAPLATAFSFAGSRALLSALDFGCERAARMTQALAAEWALERPQLQSLQRLWRRHEASLHSSLAQKNETDGEDRDSTVVVSISETLFAYRQVRSLLAALRDPHTQAVPEEFWSARVAEGRGALLLEQGSELDSVTRALEDLLALEVSDPIPVVSTSRTDEHVQRQIVLRGEETTLRTAMLRLPYLADRVLTALLGSPLWDPQAEEMERALHQTIHQTVTELYEKQRVLSLLCRKCSYWRTNHRNPHRAWQELMAAEGPRSLGIVRPVRTDRRGVHDTLHSLTEATMQLSRSALDERIVLTDECTALLPASFLDFLAERYLVHKERDALRCLYFPLEGGAESSSAATVPCAQAPVDVVGLLATWESRDQLTSFLLSAYLPWERKRWLTQQQRQPPS